MNSNKLITSIFLIIFGALLQFFITYKYNQYIENKKHDKELKKAKIQLIEKRLNEFYLPLHEALNKSKRLWINYRKRYANTEVFSEIAQGKVTKNTLRWQRYMLSVFQPLHLELSKILQKRQLALDNIKLLQQLDMLEQHIAYYNVIFMQWKYKDATENFAPTHFPKYLIKYIDEDITRLLQEKEQLLQ